MTSFHQKIIGCIISPWIRMKFCRNVLRMHAAASICTGRWCCLANESNKQRLLNAQLSLICSTFHTCYLQVNCWYLRCIPEFISSNKLYFLLQCGSLHGGWRHWHFWQLYCIVMLHVHCSKSSLVSHITGMIHMSPADNDVIMSIFGVCALYQSTFVFCNRAI